MKRSLFLVLLLATVAWASKPSSLVPATSYISDSYTSPAGTTTSYYVQSDGGGAYLDGVSSTSSKVNVNWVLDLTNSTRTAGVTLTDNAVQPGDPAYTAPANPPYTGEEWQHVKLQVDCFRVSNADMLTMQGGQAMQCPGLVRLDASSRAGYYRLDMGETSTESETTMLQVQCNGVASDGKCNDWLVDPIPVVNLDGSITPGRAIARLNFVTNRTITNEGDFYLTFHYHVTRP